MKADDLQGLVDKLSLLMKPIYIRTNMLNFLNALGIESAPPEYRISIDMETASLDGNSVDIKVVTNGK